MHVQLWHYFQFIIPRGYIFTSWFRTHRRIGLVVSPILLSIMVVLIAIRWLGICIMVGWCSVLLIGWGWCGYGNMFLYRFDTCMLLFRAFNVCVFSAVCWSSGNPTWPMSWGIGGNACYPLHAVNSYNWRPMHVPCYCNYFNISLYASTHITNVHLICMSTRQIQASISAETICWHSTKNSPRKPPSSHIHTSSLETTPHPIRSIQDIPT